MTVRLPAPGLIAGTTTLPAGFAHPHASEQAPEPHREYLRSIRRGERPLAEVLDAIAAA